MNLIKFNQYRLVLLYSENFNGVIRYNDYSKLKKTFTQCDLATHLIIEIPQDDETCKHIDKALY